MGATDLELQRDFSARRASRGGQIVAVIDPLMTIAALLGCIALFHARFQDAYLILALLVFLLTFPGKAPTGQGVRALVTEITTSWFATVSGRQR